MKNIRILERDTALLGTDSYEMSFGGMRRE
jgi:hypothetical protein